MARISKFPILGKEVEASCRGSTIAPKSQREILSTLMQLAWNDIEAFLSLEANCLSAAPIEINPRVKEELEKLELIDQNGYTPLNIGTIVRSIIFDYQCPKQQAL